MAVLSKPSRRHARKDVDGESPVTDRPRKPPESRRKRLRNNSINHESDTSNKKLKFQSKLKPHTTLVQRPSAYKTLPIRQPVGADGVNQEVKLRKLDPVLVQPKYAIPPQPVDSDDELHQGINQNIPPPKADLDKRSLRSKDGGSRSKSELAAYFNNFDDLISIEPKKPDLLTPDTILHIYDESSSTSTKASSSADQPFARSRISTNLQTNGVPATSHILEWPEETFTTLTKATRIDLSSLDARAKRPSKDPLDDDLYLKIHSREERKEKQLRNIEKERAMHEKVQLERLLDGLRGHDWLRVMGISGITDTEKKLYEPRRDHLIEEVRALLEKFRLWKEEEKRRKAEKDGALEDEEDEDMDEGDDIEEGTADDEIRDSQAESESISDGDPPDYNNVDASAARQLRLDAINAARPKGSKKRPLSLAEVPAPKKPANEKPITSFFSKPYLRAAAMGGHRRSGRSRMAFGQPLPEVEDRPFELPEDIRTTEAMLESGRRMRRSKREHEAE